MNAPDEFQLMINQDVSGLRKALSDRDAEIARLQAELAAAQEAVTIRQYALEQRTAENESLQARLDAGPEVQTLRFLAPYCAFPSALLDIANRMEAANGK